MYIHTQYLHTQHVSAQYVSSSEDASIKCEHLHRVRIEPLRTGCAKTEHHPTQRQHSGQSALCLSQTTREFGV
jgi:hypothetical protein